MASTQSLKDLIALIIDAANDGIKFSQGDKTTMMALVAFSNLMGDLMKLAPEAAQIPAEIEDLDDSEIDDLVKDVASNLHVNNAHAQGIVDAALTTAKHLFSDGKALYTAIKAS